MSVSNAKKVGDSAVTSTRVDIVFHDIGGVGGQFIEIIFDVHVLNFLEGFSFGDKLDIAITSAAGKGFVGGQPVILVDSFEKSIHEGKHFEDHLILPQIVTTFEEKSEFLIIHSEKCQLAWSHC